MSNYNTNIIKITDREERENEYERLKRKFLFATNDNIKLL